MRLAHKLLETLPPKWNPTKFQDIASNNENDNEWIPFLPSLLTVETTKDLFQIFTEGESRKEAVANYVPEHGPSIIAATDGSTIETGLTNAQAGVGVFYYDNNPKNKSLHLPPTLPQTNQVAEVTAIRAAVEDNNRIPNLYIESDSKYAINALTKTG